jgi:hypothetical protein
VVRTRERLSTSSFRRTSNRDACWRACFCSAATSGGLSIFTASLAFHPLGSCSNARLSELLLLFEPVLFSVEAAPVSDRLRGRPRSMMLPDSDWCLLWPDVMLCTWSLGSAAGVTAGSGVVPSGVGAAVELGGFSHGLGDARCSTGADRGGADRGVGKVEAVMTVVAADLGVVKEADIGVNGVLTRGESSTLAARDGTSAGVLPERRRLRDGCRIKCGAAALDVGMTSGARFFGDIGCRVSFRGRCSSS